MNFEDGQNFTADSMIEIQQFRNLQLSRYYPKIDIRTEEFWEYLGAIWHCEMVGRTQFCSTRQGSRMMTGAISIAMDTVLPTVRRAILKDLGFPGGIHMHVHAFGTVTGVERLCNNRNTISFDAGAYNIGVTRNDDGAVITMTMTDKALLRTARNQQ